MSRNARRPSRFSPAWLILTLVGSGCGGGTATSPTPAPVAAPEAPATVTAAATARYRVRFEATWSTATHPDGVPSNPHFSPLVGATHRAGVRFWSAGEPASEGIERMAELGATTPLDQTISAAIRDGRAGALLLGGGIPLSPGSVELEFEIAREFSHVTLVSMVAPSPDWFVGVSDLDLLASGDWPAQLAIELLPWDAGTDDGVTFDSPDADSQPHRPIAAITTPPLAGAAGAVRALGTFTFTRLP